MIAIIFPLNLFVSSFCSTFKFWRRVFITNIENKFGKTVMRERKWKSIRLRLWFYGAVNISHEIKNIKRNYLIKIAQRNNEQWDF